jgi:hypothetical protein
VRLVKDLDSGLEGRDVVIVEDIVDTGLTLTYLQDILRARAPRSLRTACLLSKPSRRQVEVHVEYIGFTIEDHFVVGYGLDYAEKYRNLGHIAILNGEQAIDIITGNTRAPDVGATVELPRRATSRRSGHAGGAAGHGDPRRERGPSPPADLAPVADIRRRDR